MGITATLGERESLQAQMGGAYVGSSTSEKWELLADITTTEEVNYFYITADMSGNPFVCKKLVTKLTLPSALGSVQGIGISAGQDFYSTPYWMFNLGGNYTQANAETWIEEGKFLRGLYGISTTENFASTDGGMTMRTNEANTKPYPAVRVGLQNTDKKFPTGTNLKVWGVKA